jgi:hypothetical protein
MRRLEELSKTDPYNVIFGNDPTSKENALSAAEFLYTTLIGQFFDDFCNHPDYALNTTGAEIVLYGTKEIDEFLQENYQLIYDYEDYILEDVYMNLRHLNPNEEEQILYKQTFDYTEFLKN